MKEIKVKSDPEALVAFFHALGFAVTRIGLEAGPLSQWLYAGLTQAGFETTLLETRHVKAALSAMTVKTDRQDARGIAQLLRMGWFRPVHAKSIGSQEIRALLVARKQLLGKLRDVELSIRGILRGFGLKVGRVSERMYERRIRELASGQAMLVQITEAMLAARTALQAEIASCTRRYSRTFGLTKSVATVPGVGAVVAITFKTMIRSGPRSRRRPARYSD